ISLVRVSPGGRYVLFASTNSSLTPVPDNNNASDLFVKDLQTGTISLVSVNHAATAAGNAASGTFGISGTDIPVLFSSNDRYLVFTSLASDLATNPDANGTDDVFVRDLQTGTTRLV